MAKELNKEVSSLVVKIDKDLHKKMKATCAINEISIRDYITNLIKNDIQDENRKIEK